MTERKSSLIAALSVMRVALEEPSTIAATDLSRAIKILANEQPSKILKELHRQVELFRD